MSEFRIERDSMGEVKVPAAAYYGAQTQRAVENFPISGWSLPPALIHAMGLVKYGCAVANRDLNKLTDSGKNRLNPQQVDALLAKAGADKSTILTMTFFIKDMADYPAFNEVYDAWVDPNNLPARATMKCELIDPRIRIEVLTVAAIEG